MPHDILSDAHATVAAYQVHLARTGLAPASIRAYSAHVRGFAAWLDGRVEHPASDAFTDPFSRDYATRDYRAHLLDQRAASATIDAKLAALDGLYGWLGLGPSTVKRTGTGETGYGQHLDSRESKAVLRVAERRGPRDLALIGTMRFAGLRVAEVAGLDVTDVWVSARRGELEARGKGAKVRKVALSSELRTVMDAWLLARRTWPGADTNALFLGERGTRLTDRAIRNVVSAVGAEAGVPDLHPHRLRHTCARRLIEGGANPADVQRVLGHQSLATTMLYVQGSAEQVAAAVEAGSEAW